MIYCLTELTRKIFMIMNCKDQAPIIFAYLSTTFLYEHASAHDVFAKETPSSASYFTARRGPVRY